MYLKYLNIPFKHLGRDFAGCDCFGLVQLFYNQEFNLKLPEYADYQESWHLLDAKLILKLYTKFGFTRIKDSEYKFGDVLILNENNYPKHLGIVIGGGNFIHTLQNGTACHSYLNYQYFNKIHSAYRHKKCK